MDPTEVQAFDVPEDDRAAIQDALDYIQSILLVGGLDDEQEQAENVRVELSESEAAEPIHLREADAARAVASLVAYRERLLDDGDVGGAAEVEEALRTLTSQNERLDAMMEVFE